jgi:hypothetical protein
MVVVLCYRTGGDFKFMDVELLASKIRQHWKGSEPLSILVLADKADHQMELINYTICPPENKLWPGWWTKMNLFAPSLEQYRPFLYMDLDTAVVGDLSEIIPENKEQFITLEDFYRPFKLASGLMWIPAKNDRVKNIWNTWMRGPENIMKKYRGDQEFIGSVIKQDTFWQTMFNKVFSFKPRAGWLKVLPTSAVVICFHGKPRIYEASKQVEWVNNYVKYES